MAEEYRRGCSRGTVIEISWLKADLRTSRDHRFKQSVACDGSNGWREQMTNLKILAAALVLSAASATTAFAQAAIGEPGAYAFYHPNGDVLHAGSPAPADALAAYRVDTDRVVTVAPHRTRHSRSSRVN
jgi:hypothetical protein